MNYKSKYIVPIADDIGDVLGFDPILSASLRVTKECNLKCYHCYVYSSNASYNKNQTELSLSEINEILKQLKSLGCKHIFLTGGEPFLRTDIIDIIKISFNHGMRISLSTNGTVIDNKTINKIKNFKFSMFQVSIDGPKSYHDKIRGEGVFNKVASLMLNLQKVGVENRTICFTINDINIDILPDMIDIANVLGATNLSLNLVIEGGRASRFSLVEKFSAKLEFFFEKYIKEKPNFKFSFSSTVPISLIPSKILEEQGIERFLMCSFPYIVGISEIGVVAPCDGLLGNPNLYLGSIREKSLQEIWFSNKALDIRRKTKKAIKGVCTVCKWLIICGGGCKASSYFHYHDLNSSDPICQQFYQKDIFSKENIIKM